jgi:hypothetical protein
VLAAVTVALAGCGSDEPPRTASATPTATPSATATPKPKPREVRRSHCPADVAGCKATRGRIIYVERVDPDGDGDLHVVVEDSRSITLPGLTAVDVAKELRPARDPGVGDHASAAGPVQTGSYGQAQIHALEFHVRRG